MASKMTIEAVKAKMQGISWDKTGSDDVLIWYPDGKLCANILGNWELNISASEVAQLICEFINGTENEAK